MYAQDNKLLFQKANVNSLCSNFWGLNFADLKNIAIIYI